MVTSSLDGILVFYFRVIVIVCMSVSGWMSSPSRPFLLIVPSLRHVVKGRAREDFISSYLLPYHSSSSSLFSSLHPHPLHSLNTRSITMATQCTFHPSSSFDDHSLQVSASIVLSPRSGQSSPSNLLSTPTSDAFCEY